MKYLSVSEIAKLTNTTERTIRFYDEKNLLKPHKVNEAGYRFYLPEQAIDFQAIALLRLLGFSINEIKSNSSLKELFKSKKVEIQKEIAKLQKNLNLIESYYENLEKGHMIKTKLKNIPAQKIFYIEKIGPYSKVFEYIKEMKKHLTSLPKDAKFFVIDEKSGYHPLENRMKICVKASRGVKSSLKTMKFESYQALSYLYKGPINVLNLQWRYLYNELERLNLEESEKLHTIEIYNKVSKDECEIELQIPIK